MQNECLLALSGQTQSEQHLARNICCKIQQKNVFWGSEVNNLQNLKLSFHRSDGRHNHLLQDYTDLTFCDSNCSDQVAMPKNVRGCATFEFLSEDKRHSFSTLWNAWWWPYKVKTNKFVPDETSWTWYATPSEKYYYRTAMQSTNTVTFNSFVFSRNTS